MKTYSIIEIVTRIALTFALLLILEGAIAQKFLSGNLQDVTIANPTSLQFGPDNKLYVAQQDGVIKIFTIAKEDVNSYKVTSTETVSLIKQIPNHNDDGTLNTSINKRQVTGLLVTGTSDHPIIYVASSDSRMGATTIGDVDLCTNSGVISRLSRNGNQWEKLDLVRGLPRSEENHAPNGLQIDEVSNLLFVAVGGFTNAGAPSKMFTYSSEYALSAAILSIDLNVIDSMPVKMDATGNHPYVYDIPTLDDPTRSNNPDGTDINDPWGGNDGLNQAKIVPGGPVQIHASGFRNPYDILITKTPGRERRMYTIDNGANSSLGGYPVNEGIGGNVTNEYDSNEPGSSGAGINDPQVNNLDGLEYIGQLDTYIPGTYYGGHPCPIRANPLTAGLYTHAGPVDAGTGVWRNSTSDPNYPLPVDWPPVPVAIAKPVEGDFRNPGETDLSLITFKTSTNGICEYTASDFNMQGDILAVGYKFNGCIYRIRMTPSGDGVLNTLGAKKLNTDTVFASELNKPLDIISQGDNDPFPGTIWVCCYGSNTIIIFEPVVETLNNFSSYESREPCLYPNPFRDKLNIHFDQYVESSYLIEVYNAHGIIVYKKNIENYSGAYQFDLDISDVPAGIYKVKIFSNNYQKIQTFKIVKE